MLFGSLGDLFDDSQLNGILVLNAYAHSAKEMNVGDGTIKNFFYRNPVQES